MRMDIIISDDPERQKEEMMVIMERYENYHKINLINDLCQLSLDRDQDYKEAIHRIKGLTEKHTGE